METAHGFTLSATRSIPELATQAQLFHHAATGAQLLSLVNNDPNKTFGVAFRTIPGDSTGVAHILEHIVLGGSAAYPLKDPFAVLLGGSLASFINAITYSDKTIYPVASPNQRDFYTLTEVYLDAVFAPLLRPESFLQEAWHYEPAVDGSLRYKGVVFNEMKGSLAAPEVALRLCHMHTALFPDAPYVHNSGGDPHAIVDLSNEQLAAFYHAHYHPANALFVFWGDDPPEERLRLLDQRLAAFGHGSSVPPPRLQPPFATPRRAELTYQPDDVAARPFVAVAWALPELTGPEEMFALRVLHQLLLGTPAAPLHKALLDAGLATGLVESTFVGDDGRQPTFLVALRGVDPARVDAVEPLVLETLTKLAHGLDPLDSAAALNRVEFCLRERRRGTWLDPYPGVIALLNAVGAWNYGRDPLAALAFAEPFAALRARAEAGPLFEELITRLLVDNPHRATILLRPDLAHNPRLDAHEQARLVAARAAMSAAEVQAHTEAADALRCWQEAPDPPALLAALPRLQLADLDQAPSRVPATRLDVDMARALHHELPTGGVAYVDLGLDLGVLPAALLPYAAIFGRLLLETGAGAADAVRLTQRVGRTTGGLRAEVLVESTADGQAASAWLFLRGKALAERGADLAAILGEVLLTPHLEERGLVQQIVQSELAAREAQLAAGAPPLLRTRLHARLTPMGWAAEATGGVAVLGFLRDLIGRIETAWPDVLAELRAVQTLLVRRGQVVVGLTADMATQHRVAPALARLAEVLPAGAGERVGWPGPGGPQAEGVVVGSQVNYVAKGGRLSIVGAQSQAAALVANSLISNRWLWEQVRLKGGAYGGWSEVDLRTGVYHAQSYRDPNLEATFAACDAAGAFLRSTDMGEDSLTRAIIGAVRDSDPYEDPEGRGFAALRRTLAGETDAQRKALRAALLTTTAAEVRAMAEALDALSAQGAVVVFGGQAALEAAAVGRTERLTLSRP